MTDSTTKTVRPLVALAAAAATGLAVSACAGEPEHVTLPADRLEEALLSAEEVPVDGVTAIDVLTEEATRVTSEYMDLPGGVEGADEACAAALDGVYPEDGLTANTADGRYGGPDDSTLTIGLSSFHERLDFHLGDRYQEIGHACDGQTLRDEAGVGVTFHSLAGDADQGFIMHPAERPDGEEGQSAFDVVVLMEQQGSDVIEVVGMGLSERQAADVLAAQSDKLAGHIDDA